MIPITHAMRLDMLVNVAHVLTEIAGRAELERTLSTPVGLDAAVRSLVDAQIGQTTSSIRTRCAREVTSSAVRGAMIVDGAARLEGLAASLHTNIFYYSSYEHLI